MNGDAGSQPDEAMLRIATAPINWNNSDLTGWRSPVPFPALLDEMRAAGYTATEYGANFPTDAGPLRAVLGSRDMSLCGAYQWLPLRDPLPLTDALTTLAPTLAVLHASGCRDLIIADALTPERAALAGHVPGDGSASLSHHGVQQIADGAARTAALARDYGIAVHYHNHVGTYIETPGEVDRLLPMLHERRLDLCFDTGHFAYGGGDPVAFVKTHAARIGYLHLKDVDGAMLHEAKRRRWSFLEALRHIVFAPLGAGIVDIPGIIGSLREHAYAGWIVIEQDTCAGDATETARRNRDYLRSIADRTRMQPGTRLRSQRWQ